MEEWNELWCFEDGEAVQLAAAQTLQNCGIKVPRREPPRHNTRRAVGGATFFGVPLESGQQPSVAYQYGRYGKFKLPRFLVEAVQFLEHHLTRQGLFRKAGSVSRQKSLKAALDSGKASIPEDANVHDIATLLKQYFRELPEPLITSRLFPVFEACYSLGQPAERQRCVLLACLLLPQMHLQCLCVLMNLLHCVSESASESLMDAANLAIVLAPNIMRPHFDIITVAQGNPIKNQTGIAQLLIESAPWIGCVPSSVYAVRRPVREKHKTPTIEADKEVKVQNSVMVQNSIDNGLNVQKTSDNVPKVEKPVENNVPRVHNVQEDGVGNDIKSWKDSDGEVKVQKVSENEVKGQRNEVKGQSVSENDVKVRNSAEKIRNSAEKVQNSRDSVPTVQRSPVAHVEEIAPAAHQATKEEEPAPRVKENELASPSSWTGSLLYVSLIGLLVLVVALALSKVMYF